MSGGKKSFWESTPALLAGLGTLATGIAALAVAFYPRGEAVTQQGTPPIVQPETDPALEPEPEVDVMTGYALFAVYAPNNTTIETREVDFFGGGPAVGVIYQFNKRSYVYDKPYGDQTRRRIAEPRIGDRVRVLSIRDHQIPNGRRLLLGEVELLDEEVR